MKTIGGVSSGYGNVVQTALRRNTAEQVVEAKESGEPVDVEQIQTSNQEIRDQARETGVELYSSQLQKQSFETYVESSQNASSSSEEEQSEPNEVYTYDPQKANDTVQTAQKRSFAIDLYDRVSSEAESQGGGEPRPTPLNISV